ncbi:hypothetical protein C3B58_12370 [Lactonifactor longoviformis]|uniref:CheW-like domain-containing protein n=1 Tax=Lactonifactor longoviformis DSM 17459 TaxID=1122155 RepID=A0A1M4TRR8_9CLOT|nr:hypothetical protein [Lactonifactor longoviformis]POP32356.1 hypothetical protein C3B58_12370 [Lactonifactor longoviformis]SHE47106.1 hypothetical protein SAMN02745158_00560 [Lactonifactor longoviformis DSM 17459]
MDYITVNTGTRIFYIEKKMTEAIVRDPEILTVPEGEENLLGLSVYHGRLVVYHQLGDKKSYSCGIIIKAGGEMLPGIPADTVGEEEADPSCLTMLMEGVWGKKSD